MKKNLPKNLQDVPEIMKILEKLKIKGSKDSEPLVFPSKDKNQNEKDFDLELVKQDIDAKMKEAQEGLERCKTLKVPNVNRDTESEGTKG